jgi:signal transduction histidine kinase
MLTILINYFLVFSSGIEILLIWLLIRQENKTFFSSTYLYVVLLFLIDTLASIFILNSPSQEVTLITSNTRFITECFIIAILYNFAYLFTFKTTPPKLSLKNTLTFLIAFVLSVAGLSNIIIEDIRIVQQIYIAEFSLYYWALIVFFIAVFYMIFVNIISRYRLARRQHETGTIREILTFVFPVTFISLSTLYILPFLKIFHPLFFLAYFAMAVLLIYSAFRFYILEADDYSFKLVPQVLSTGIVLLILFILFHKDINLATVLLSVPGFLLLAVMSNYVDMNFANAYKKLGLGYTEDLDQKIEEFSTNIVKFIDIVQFWNYIARFIQETFHFKKIAIVSFQYDISPYQIEMLIGFEQENLKKLLSDRNSPILEALESERKIVNKFEYPDNMIIFQEMDSLDIQLCLPLLKHHEILGVIFMGDDRKSIRIPQRYFQLLKLISTQIAFAVDNIGTLQKTMQAQKMAEIGMLASQLAHDFQSFISIVKLENKGNTRLSDYANYTEKLVQDLLNYARPQELKFNLVNINHLIDMSLELAELSSNIAIEKHYADDIPEINVDINQLRRVFTNLIENSNRAMKDTEKKRIKITTKTLRPISKVQRNPWIYIEFLDEGSGIPEENLGRIFDPFFTTHRDEGGNGMGLAIANQIITRHHGFIDVTSRPGKGTIFNIRLPHIII